MDDMYDRVTKNEYDTKEEVEEMGKALYNEYKTLVDEIFKLERQVIKKKQEDDFKGHSTATLMCGDIHKDTPESDKTVEGPAFESDSESVRTPPIKDNEADIVKHANDKLTRISSSSSIEANHQFRQQPTHTTDSEGYEPCPRHKSFERQQCSVHPNRSSSRQISNNMIRKPIPSEASIAHSESPPSPMRRSVRNSGSNLCSDCKFHEKYPSSPKMRSSYEKPREAAEPAKQKDKIERFCDHLGRKLRRFERLQRVLAERMIAEICTHARRGRLSVGAVGKFTALLAAPDSAVEETETEQKEEIKKSKSPERGREMTTADMDAIIRREKALLARYSHI